MDGKSDGELFAGEIATSLGLKGSTGAISAINEGRSNSNGGIDSSGSRGGKSISKGNKRKGGKGGAANNGSGHNSKNCPKPQLQSALQLTGIKSPLYSAKFCPSAVCPSYGSYFAVVGGNRVTICRCEGAEEGSGIEVIQSYVDPCLEEEFFCCTWMSPLRDSSDFRGNSNPVMGSRKNSQNTRMAAPTSLGSESSLPVLEECASSDDDLIIIAVAGKSGIIKLIDCDKCHITNHMVGHGNHVNELMVHPRDRNLLFSVSKDESIRIWNVLTRVCVAVFAGDNGHRDDVLSADVHMAGAALVSAGLDNTIKIWDLTCSKVADAVSASYETPCEKEKLSPFRTTFVQFPVFDTSRVHTDYVDCVRWVGNLILSKSTENKIVLWKPDVQRRKDAIIVLRELVLDGADIWFLRFALSEDLSKVAVGNKSGQLFVWDLDSTPEDRLANGHLRQEVRATWRLNSQKCRSTVRQTAFSPDGSTLVCCCDDATVWRWD